MAQYYQVLSQTDKDTGEIKQFYQNIDETRTVQYVIEPEEHQQDFQTQEVVVSDRLMVVDGQPQQVILGQTPVAYEASSYIIQEPLTNFQNRHQQVYYMAGPQHASQVVVDQTPQPIVLNHQIMPNQNVANRSLIGPQQNVNSSPMQVNQQPRQMKPVARSQIAISQKNPVQMLSPLVLQNLQRQKVRVTPVHCSEQNDGKTVSSSRQDSLESVTLSDGSIMPYAHYKRLIAQQKAKQALQESARLESPLTIPVTSPRKGRNANRARVRNRVPNRGSRPGPPPVSFINPNSVLDQSNIAPPQMKHPQIAQPNYRVQEVMPDSLMQQQSQQKQLLAQQNQNQYLIQSPRQNAGQKPSALPSFLHSSQIQHIIENTPISEEYSDSIRMLVLLENGEQRLITFTLPKEACTIHEILEQVNVPYTPDTPIQVTEANINGLNYVVTVGNVSYANETNNQNEETPPDEPQPPPPVKESSPEPPLELPKLVSGQLAVCAYCGYLSEDFNRCTRCKTKLPDNVKAISSSNTAGKKIDARTFAEKKVALAKSLQKNQQLLQKRRFNSKSKIVEETVVLSSDEESDSKAEKKVMNDELFDKLSSTVTISPISKEPSLVDIQKNSILSESQGADELLGAEATDSLAVRCRTVRIGSYRFTPPDDVRVSTLWLVIKIPHPKQNVIKEAKIARHEIVKVLVSFQKSLPVIFYYLTPSAASTIRNSLDMTKNSEYYYDPLSESDETHKRITLLPDNFNEDMRYYFKHIYSQPNILVDELTPKEANNILMKTCPKEFTKSAINFGNLTEIKHLLTYPPEGRGRISINTEDYMCLAQEQFLNDVVIDFYLKYILNHLPKEQQEKIHIFSTFFYNRLTTKPLKACRKSQPSETDTNLTPAQKRHARVKTWTKNINIFEKDFIIIPLNENCHWFLAIICFPGMNGTHTMDGRPIKIEPKTLKRKKTLPTPVNSSTATNVKEKPESIVCEDPELSDKDEADGDDSELDSDESEEPTTPQTVENENKPPIKQPCILIFDSLAGASRSRVVATLRDYLTCEYKAKMNEEKIYTKDVIKGACPKVPQQTNFTDCGLYLLQYVEQFFKDPIKDYYIPISHLKTWFNEMTVTRKREDISNIIKMLMKQHGADLSVLPDIVFPTLNGEIFEQGADDKFKEDEEEEEGEIRGDSMECESESSSTHTDNTEIALNSLLNSQGETPENSPVKPSIEGITINKNDIQKTFPNTTWLKPDVSEISRQSNKDTLSYLKAKRINRHKNVGTEGPDVKKIKNSDSLESV